jgi:hypothetical protein
MMGRHLGLAALGMCALIGVAGPACGDAVTDWNEIAQQAIAVGRPGPIGAVDSALVQVAVHDAVQAIDRRFEPYHVEIKGANGSRSAAAAAAAHAVLVGMYPAQGASLDAAYFSYLSAHGLNNDPGLLVGEKVAAGILPLRRVDPNPLPPPFVGGTGIGQWRPTPSFIPNSPPPSNSPMAVHWMSAFDPFTLTGPTRFRPDPPPALTSERYTADYDEVKRLGAFASTDRTPEQTDLAYFYTDNFLAQWNRALRGIANQHLRRTGDTARLFALANLATADALITSWDSKKFYFFWRPMTAINEGENDGNPNTAGDPTWQPLINNPNYPDYTSGANNVVGAMTRTLQLFFGRDHVTFEVSTLAPLATTKSRTYNRFSDAAADVVEVRIYLGIHFRFADVAARKQGQQVAEHAFDHFLLPLHDNESDHRWDD